MALRSLQAVMLKALPRRMPSSRTFATKGNPWSKSSAKLTDATKYGCVDDTYIAKRWPDIARNMKLRREESEREMRIYNWNTVLMGIVGCCYVWHFTSCYILSR